MSLKLLTPCFVTSDL